MAPHENDRSIADETDPDIALRYYKAIVQSSDDAIISKSLDGIVTSWNPGAERMFGYTAVEMVGKSILLLLPPERQQEELFILERLRLGEKVDHFESVRLHKNGRRIDVSITSSPVRDESGRIIGASKIARDISEQRRLEIEASRLAAIVASSDDAIISKSLEGIVTSWNPGAQAIFGYTAEEMVGTPIRRLMPPDRQDEETFILERIKEGERIEHFESIRLCKDGSLIDVSVTISPLRDSSGDIIGASKIARNITARKRVERRLHLAATVFTHSSEAIVITDAAGIIIDVNDAFTQITGYAAHQALGETGHLFISERNRPQLYDDARASLAATGHWHGEVWSQARGGASFAALATVSAVRDEQQRLTSYVALFCDVTPLRIQQEKLLHIAHFDQLTELPNRLMLSTLLEQEIVRTRRSGEALAVVFLDIDRFKRINDEYGHDVGDQLLIAVAQRMKAALRGSDTLARFGGDEFVGMLTRLQSLRECEPLLRRLLKAASSPVQIGDVTLQVSVSIGVTFYPQDPVDVDQLVRHADQAMYQAKLHGRNRYQVFDVLEENAFVTRSADVEQLARALEQGEFVLHYQPKVNMQTGAVVGAEALIRWQHPADGLLLPAAFLAVTEDHRISIALGEWVITTALAQMTSWRAQGFDVPVSVNVGARQLQDKDFVARLTAIIAAQADFRPHSLELEILESRALEDVDHVSKVMVACSRIGVGFAIDDFGTGYSSLTYLKRLPAATLKLDQSFVRDMLHDASSVAIVQGVVGLVNAFQRELIAEGVETIAHGTLLLTLGCTLAQGYAIARPMPAAAMPGWAATWRADAAWTGRKTTHAGRHDVALAVAAVELRHRVRMLQSYLDGDAQSVPASLVGSLDGKPRSSTLLTPFARLDGVEAAASLESRMQQTALALIAAHQASQAETARSLFADIRTIGEQLLKELSGICSRG